MLPVKLDDKYSLKSGRIYVTGSQALVRLPLAQAWRDAADGLNTAGFISGYRGSPLGIYDMALWQADKHLKNNNILFQPGVNEDLAAAAVWGTQHVPLLDKPRYDGVFSMWYGKGPGVDRSADVLKHGNYGGTSPKGGVLVLCGDDHAAASSTLAHQSDHALVHCGIPILHPADIQEYIDLGLYGFALSRYSGCWVGFKCVTDTVDGSASILVDPERARAIIPTDFPILPGEFAARFEVAALAAEKRLFERRLLAAQAFVRANNLDQVRLGTKGRKRLGIVSTGKSYLDVMEGLKRLGVGPDEAAALGIGVYKVAMVWPLEPERITAFAEECDDVLVIEEKRGVIEEQLAHILFNIPADRRPRLVGKNDENRRPYISQVGELNSDDIMQTIAERYLLLNEDRDVCARFNLALAARTPHDTGLAVAIRPPSFCAGCPHNTSTRVPEGSEAMGGIGCHGMALFMPERKTLAIYHMGGEGAPWIGQAPFVDTPHIFQNIGDGTYFHSGLLALRACVAAGVNITYKILLNGAIGMTGGQPIEGERFEGELTAPHVAQQVHAEGVKRIAVVTDDIHKFGSHSQFPAITTFHHRDDLDAVQREIREWKGTSVIIYDQSCATERRRLRKRGKIALAEERLFINPEVCEGCGDCGVQSNCIAIEPLETRLGRKRRINQSTCNTDYSCLKGFCPSFVTVKGGRPRVGYKSEGDNSVSVADLAEPTLPVIADTFNLLVTGIGGNGVVTIGAILGMAAHLEDRPCTVLDMSGFAQRNGSVMSHVRFAAHAQDAHPARIPLGSADVILGCDPIVAASPASVDKMARGRTSVVVNRFVAPTNAFAANPDFNISFKSLEQAISKHMDGGNLFSLEATRIAQSLIGDAIGANMFIVGYAWQKGLIPLKLSSIEGAMRLNGSAIEMNLKAFALGRIAATHPERLYGSVKQVELTDQSPEQRLTSTIASRVALLTAYQNPAYAARYKALVDRVSATETKLGTGKHDLAETIASVYARLLRYKDEYEVARLFIGEEFRKHLTETFEGDYSLSFNLAPPLLARRDAKTGRLRKMPFGPWMMNAFRLLAPLKILRGTPLDIFGYSEHRRMERGLIREYEELVDHILKNLDANNYPQAIELAQIAGTIRGYDVVKEKNLEDARKRQADVRKLFDAASGK